METLKPTKKLVELAVGQDKDNNYNYKIKRTGKKVEADIVGLAKLFRIAGKVVATGRKKTLEDIDQELKREVVSRRPEVDVDAYIKSPGQYHFEYGKFYEVHFFVVNYMKIKQSE